MTRLRCAIYTRKSSEEGLEQSFNSLDAQREACEAYILSQRSEGWITLPAMYDDGGFSGGSMDRPALRRLLDDITAGTIDVVVVYKVDRLTRSLTDFSRIVDVFDQSGVSFVSVTQAFNTTTSMGRLTLNVLLSFAQFEREVTEERIRDKIAASKAKGMWMGGSVPFGYDRKDRELIPNAAEAGIVRHAFARYLELGSVLLLKDELEDNGVRTRVRQMRNGTTKGGVFFQRGALFHLLRNRVYIGQIVHGAKVYPGLHAPLIEPELFEAVQTKMGAAVRKSRHVKPALTSPLSGLLFDADGHPMSPSHARGQRGGRYRYYVSSALLEGRPPQKDDVAIRRLSATPVEDLVLERLRRLSGKAFADWPRIRPFLRRVDVHADAVIMTVAQPHHAGWIGRTPCEDKSGVLENGMLQLTIFARLKTRGGRTWLVDQGGSAVPRRTNLDHKLIGGLRRAHAALEGHGINLIEFDPTLRKATGIPDPYLRKLARLAFLAPSIQRRILDGHQPAGLKLEQLITRGVPLTWKDQESVFGFPA